MLQCSLCGSAACVAVCCSVCCCGIELQQYAVHYAGDVGITLDEVTIYVAVCVAVCCSVLRCVAVCVAVDIGMR